MVKKVAGRFKVGAGIGYNEGIDKGLFAFSKGAKAPNFKKDPVSRVGYHAGRIGADIAGDHSRGTYWRWNHPLAVTQWAGQNVATKAGLSAGAAAAAGIGLTQVLELASGNMDLRNLDESGRPMGYSAIFTSEKEEYDPETGQTKTVVDRTTTSNPVAEFGARYFLGRTGNLLPWDDFKKERPDITPEEYQRYQASNRNPTFFGLEETNPLKSGLLGGLTGAALAARKSGPRNFQSIGKSALIGSAIGGIAPKLVEPLTETRVIQGTADGLDGREVRLMGYRIPERAAIATAAAAGGLYAGAKYLKHKKMFPGLFVQDQQHPSYGLSKYSQPNLTAKPRSV
ncbi:MAG: hypothetical protein AAGA83_00405 [Cyanobacteria bacterium P01_F01_bin.116]